MLVLWLGTRSGDQSLLSSTPMRSSTTRCHEEGCVGLAAVAGDAVGVGAVDDVADAGAGVGAVELADDAAASASANGVALALLAFVLDAVAEVIVVVESGSYAGVVGYIVHGGVKADGCTTAVNAGRYVGEMNAVVVG